MEMTTKFSKAFIVDTNVLMEDPDAFKKMGDDNCIIVLSEVRRELDRNKEKGGEPGFQARNAIKRLKAFVQSNLDKMVIMTPKPHCANIGADLGGTGTTYPVPDTYVAQIGNVFFIQGFYTGNNTLDFNQFLLDAQAFDASILKQAQAVKAYHIADDIEVDRYIIVSNDIDVQLNALTVGFEAQAYQNTEVSEESIKYNGRAVLISKEENTDAIQKIYQKFLVNKEVEFEDIEVLCHDYEFTDKSVPNNTYFQVFIEGMMEAPLMLFRYYNKKAIALREPPTTFKHKMKNDGQRFAFDALFAPASELPLVILEGPAGTAKTFLAMAVGTYCVAEEGGEKCYGSILTTRPNVKFDADIGFLPGTEQNKVGPLLRPVTDNLTQITRKGFGKNNKGGFNDGVDPIKLMMESGQLKMESMAFMRGRSLQDTYLFVDEAQNSTQSQMLGIVSRIGKNSKVIIAGDVMQIDTTALSRANNGLAAVIDKMMYSKYSAQVSFTQDECERSDLAREVVDRWENPRREGE